MVKSHGRTYTLWILCLVTGLSQIPYQALGVSGEPVEIGISGALVDPHYVLTTKDHAGSKEVNFGPERFKVTDRCSIGKHFVLLKLLGRPVLSCMPWQRSYSPIESIPTNPSTQLYFSKSEQTQEPLLMGFVPPPKEVELSSRIYSVSKRNQLINSVIIRDALSLEASWENLPVELVEQVFGYLDSKSLRNCFLVEKRCLASAKKELKKSHKRTKKRLMGEKNVRLVLHHIFKSGVPLDATLRRLCIALLLNEEGLPSKYKRKVNQKYLEGYLKKINTPEWLDKFPHGKRKRVLLQKGRDPITHALKMLIWKNAGEGYKYGPNMRNEKQDREHMASVIRYLYRHCKHMHSVFPTFGSAFPKGDKLNVPEKIIVRYLILLTLKETASDRHPPVGFKELRRLYISDDYLEFTKEMIEDEVPEEKKQAFLDCLLDPYEGTSP